MNRLPSLFVSHGAPTFAIEPGLAGPQLTALGRALPRPRAVLVVSPHWMTPSPRVGLVARPQTIHDFCSRWRAQHGLAFCVSKKSLEGYVASRSGWPVSDLQPTWRPVAAELTLERPVDCLELLMKSMARKRDNFKPPSVFEAVPERSQSGYAVFRKKNRARGPRYHAESWQKMVAIAVAARPLVCGPDSDTMAQENAYLVYLSISVCICLTRLVPSTPLALTSFTQSLSTSSEALRQRSVSAASS